jgi:hypothetical protein
MQIHDKTRRMLETRGHVQAVSAGQAPEVKPPWLAGRCSRSTPGQTHADRDNDRPYQMATTSDDQARRFHWRYWTPTTTGTLNYSETFTNRSTIRNG